MNEAAAPRTYAVKEIFHSLQGEGVHAGTAAAFVRLAGCNLSCPFCDTDHLTAPRSLTAEAIAAEAAATGALVAVVTGGEPALQLDEALVKALHSAGLRVHVETNGSLPLPPGVDWVTCSPKVRPLRLHRVDELKVLMGAPGLPEDPQEWLACLPEGSAPWLCVQPCAPNDDMAAEGETVERAVAFVKAHPRWRLSLQLHKLIHIP